MGRCGADAIAWIDVSRAEPGEIAPDLSEAQAMARFHVRDNDGTLLDGGDAFARLWASLPGFRTAGRLFRRRPFAWLLNRGYDAFLPLRPHLQAMVPGTPASVDDGRRGDSAR